MLASIDGHRDCRLHGGAQHSLVEARGTRNG
jgi:hypothetical protein